MANETKHTPGPWRVHSERTAPYYVKDAEVYAGDVMICGHILARAESDGDGLKVVAGERAANARLIAASPELLETLQALLPYLTTQEDLLNYASLNEGRASGFDIASVKARAAIAKATGATRD